jgi:hypothetical protein
MGNFIILSYFKMINQAGRGGRYLQHVWGRKRMRTKFELGSLKGIDHLEDLGVDGRVILK